jgi:NAD(P)-dependent dehydrogenase (short-subunit alcohol dehydrogenase family)
MDLEGKVAVVTGASAGIGRAYALALAGAGATTIAVARTRGRLDGEPPARNTLEEVVQAGAALPGPIHAHVCDLEDESQIVGTIRQTAATFGRIDVLVNNAALLSRFDPLAVSGDDWDRVMRTNVRAAYLATREAAAHMIRQRSGSVVNVTAKAGDARHHFGGMLVYSVSKAALDRLTVFMANELQPYGIAVNSLSPGTVLTDTAAAANPRAATSKAYKAATPEVLGPALLALAQQTADTLTGRILHTDDFPATWP